MSAERAKEIAAATIGRLTAISPDALVVYDIADESARNPDKRPFPFSPTMDASEFVTQHLHGWTGRKIIYRAVGKYTEDSLGAWLTQQNPDEVSSVFVGASNADQVGATSLRRAYTLRDERRPELTLGGVAIPERHTKDRCEHEKLIAKQESGCSFFITQIIYDVNAAKNLLSDYRLECRRRGIAPVPIVLTFSVAGSLTTLEFMRWLGISVPTWVDNDVANSLDPLATSHAHALAAAADLADYCRRMRIPFGINIESVSARRAEIDSAMDLALRVSDLLR
ncbi:methylenetetrahydrofolate reductase [Williamsia sp. Leaf354]|uniref:methylenetetrahydrofolate reductase n=1 Tax=Williamsia sp. Leaf354 TaxID=1736349 RepID=UPI000B0E9FB2|nr:methylenetetrahydrofolate reductase [Williamsia sp. Leaf354]